MLSAAGGRPLPAPLEDEESSASKRETYFRLLTLYGRDDAESVAEAERILNSLLPRSESDKVNPEDKFAHSAAVIFYRLCSAKLPAALRERARLDIANRVTAIEQFYYPQRRTNFHMGHTNFALMYLEAFILGSEIIGNTAAAAKAYEAFDEWCDYTLHNGFTEFNAPNYYKVNLHCLSSLAAASVNPRVRRRAAAFAEWLWFETALHYWPSQDWLTGANSRNYTYIGGVGGALNLVRHFFSEGGNVSASRLEQQKKGGEAGWLASFEYEPPAYIRAVAREKQRCIYQGLWLAPEVDAFRRGYEGEGFQQMAHGEFGHQYGKDRYTYFEPAYALGTSGAQYSSQDRTLVSDIASRKPLASIFSHINTSVPFDASGDWLGFLGRSHLPTGAAAVQDRNLAMMLYSVMPLYESGKANKPLSVVAPLLLLPANVDAIFINEKPADRQPGWHPLSAKDVLYLQEGDVYAALRFVAAAKGFAGYKPSYHYRLDGCYELKTRTDGVRGRRSFPVGAMACVLYNGAGKIHTETDVTAGFVVELATKKEHLTLADFRRHIEQNTGVAQNFRNGIWEASYRSGNRDIFLKKDLRTGLILDKRVNGIRVEPPVHATSFSKLENQELTISWKGVIRNVDLSRGVQ